MSHQRSKLLENQVAFPLSFDDSDTKSEIKVLYNFEKTHQGCVSTSLRT